VPSLRDFLAEAWGHVLEHFGDLRPGQPGGLRVIAEPGRAMAAECFTAVVRVLGKAVRKGKPWYYLDDGVYGTFSGQFYGKNAYPVLADAGKRPLKPCVLAGPTCDSLDIVDETQPMPDLEIGELLMVPSVGAYSLACASTFNGLPLPKTAAIDDDPALEG
jgi:ornithine decarboxylase